MNPIQFLKNIYSEILRYEKIKKITEEEERDDKQEKELKKDAKKWRIKYIERHFKAKKAKYPGTPTF